MINEMRDQQYKKFNLLFLRRYLNLTQKDFIREYLADRDGKARISTSTLSNIETKGGAQLDNIIARVSSKLNINRAVFDMPTALFIKRIDTLIAVSSKRNSPEPSKANVRVLVRQLTGYFAEQIFDGKLKAGGKMKSDRDLAKRFGVSRTAIREALKVFYIMGLVDIRPSQGTFLCKDTSSFFVIPLSWSVFLNPKQTHDILECRNTLETEAAQEAANCADPVALNQLTAITETMRSAYEARNSGEFLKLDLRFHRQIAVCSENPVIRNLIQTLSNMICRLNSGGRMDFEQITDIYCEHQRIYGFIMARNSAAAGEAMRTHLENSLTRCYY